MTGVPEKPANHTRKGVVEFENHAFSAFLASMHSLAPRGACSFGRTRRDWYAKAIRG